MDNPQPATSSFSRKLIGTQGFFGKKKNKSGASLSSFFQPIPASEEVSDVSDTASIASSVASSRSNSNYTYSSPHQERQLHLNKFTKNASMTPFESRHGHLRTGSSVSLGSKIKQRSLPNKLSASEKRIREKERWANIVKLNESYKANDPLIHAEDRLNTFLDYYDSFLRDKPNVSHEIEDTISFWACSCLKFLTGVDVVVSKNILAEFENFDLKKEEKLKMLKFDDRNLAIDWAWQLAIDNPDHETYSYTIEPIDYNDDPGPVGPINFHSVHGGSLSDLPFARNSFSFELAYNLIFELREEDWVPVLREMYRVLQPQGTLHLFLMDFATVNCENSIYNDFFARVGQFLRRKGVDPMPCRKIQARMIEAGFDEVKYSFVSLKKGVPNKVGKMMEFTQSFYEFIIFEKIGRMELTEDELNEFKELKLKYHEDLRKGELVDGFGDVYYMFAFGKKV